MYGALKGLGGASVEPEPEQEKPTTAQVRKSITGAGLVSFIIWKTYKSLKRHLADSGITPEGIGIAMAFLLTTPWFRLLMRLAGRKLRSPLV